MLWGNALFRVPGPSGQSEHILERMIRSRVRFDTGGAYKAPRYSGLSSGEQQDKKGSWESLGMKCLNLALREGLRQDCTAGINNQVDKREQRS